jgi:hypothetical protein
MLDAPAQWEYIKIILKGFIQSFSHKLHIKTHYKEIYPW